MTRIDQEIYRKDGKGVFLLKVPITFVNIIDSSTGKPKTVEIVDSQGNLKYHFLIHLFEAGVLIPDEYSATAFRCILKKIHALKVENSVLRFEVKAAPDNVVAEQELGSNDTRPDVSGMSANEALA